MREWRGRRSNATSLFASAAISIGIAAMACAAVVPDSLWVSWLSPDGEVSQHAIGVLHLFRTGGAVCGFALVVFGILGRKFPDAMFEIAGRAMRPDSRVVGMLIALIVVGAAVGAMVQISDEEAVARLEDDAYYYLQIARNVTEGHGSTFDGSTRTNGYHPLWMLFVVCCTFVAEGDRILVIRLVLAVGNLLSGITAFLALRQLGRKSAPSLAFAVGGLLVWLSHSLHATGMEVAIAIPLAIYSSCRMERLLRGVSAGMKPTTRELLMTGVVLALAQLARLDCVLFAVLLLGVYTPSAASFLERPQLAFHVGKLAMPSIVLCGFYLLCNQIFFQSMIPVSGVMKRMGSGGINLLLVRQLLGDSSWLPFVLALLVAVFALIAAAYQLFFYPGKGLGLSSTAVSLFIVLFTAYHLTDSWRLWSWYTYPIVLVLVFVVPSLFRSRGEVRSFGGIGEYLLRCLAFLFFVVVIAWAGLEQWIAAPRNEAGDFKTLNRRFALELSSHLPESSVLAMGDRGGSFAYFFPGRVVQMECLVQDRECIRAFEQGRLADYLRAQGVSVIVDYVGPELSEAVAGALSVETPRKELHLGPRASINVKVEDEIARLELVGSLFDDDTVIAWKWRDATVLNTGATTD